MDMNLSPRMRTMAFHDAWQSAAKRTARVTEAVTP
jgi:hypothetical protein